MPAALQNHDMKILKLLQNDCSQTVSEIARQVGLSTSPCWRRIAQLEEQGLIRKRVAVLDHARLGMEVIAFINVRLSQHGRENLKQFEEEIRRFPEVLECYTVTGDTDYLLKIVARDIRHFEAFLRDNLMAMPMIRETHSTIAVTEIKDTTELPLDTQL
ncbi:MAG: Lrp/AsnC family transcriptional regulator [Gammaproteobacteria bacterium]|nr:Lrp/AsnC family transcriptional regulator [Gammaproteobacteria bacterium]